MSGFGLTTKRETVCLGPDEWMLSAGQRVGDVSGKTSQLAQKEAPRPAQSDTKNLRCLGRRRRTRSVCDDCNRSPGRALPATLSRTSQPRNANRRTSTHNKRPTLHVAGSLLGGNTPLRMEALCLQVPRLHPRPNALFELLDDAIGYAGVDVHAGSGRSGSGSHVKNPPSCLK